MPPVHGHEGRVDRILGPVPPPIHQNQTRQAFYKRYSTRYVVSSRALLSFLNSFSDRTDPNNINDREANQSTATLCSLQNGLRELLQIKMTKPGRRSSVLFN